MAQCSYSLLIHGDSVSVSRSVLLVATFRHFESSRSSPSLPLTQRRRIGRLTLRQHHLNAGRLSTTGFLGKFTPSNTEATATPNSHNHHLRVPFCVDPLSINAPSGVNKFASQLAAAPIPATTTAAGVVMTASQLPDSEPLGSEQCFLGLDFGTSGARAVVIDGSGNVLSDVKQEYPIDEEGKDGRRSPSSWRSALFSLLASLPAEQRIRLAAISLDGTSATMLIVDRRSASPLSPPLMYNDSVPSALPFVRSIAPPLHTTTAASSTLCKLVGWWKDRVRGGEGEEGDGATGDGCGDAVLMHQADWLLALLHGNALAATTDYNNALKLGYDPASSSFPPWLVAQPFASMLPAVVAPGTTLATVSEAVGEEYGLPSSCLVCAGTTDSIAAFLAAQVAAPGQAVTSLGSTLAVKQVSTVRVDDARFGIYSHLLPPGDWAATATAAAGTAAGAAPSSNSSTTPPSSPSPSVWLVGGASNSGGAVLREFFSDVQLQQLSASIDPSVPSPRDYYPLPSRAVGERFPVNDPTMQPRLSPRPDSDSHFLHGLFESTARIEASAYSRLADLGATPVAEVFTAGGGAANDVWTAIRQRVIGVPVRQSGNTDAAFGAALLAREGYKTHLKR